MRYSIGLLVLLGLLFAGESTAAPTGVGPLPGDIANFVRPQEFRDHLLYMGETPTEGEPGVYRVFTVRLDPIEPSIDPGHLVFGGVINQAAQYYAISSNKYTFTLGELIDEGWLPYLIPDWEPHRQEYIANSDATPLLQEHWDVTPYMGSADWVLKQKNRILGNFHNQCNWTRSRGLTKYSSVRQPRLDFQPPFNKAFWVNPFTREPAVIGTKAGDLIEWDQTRGYDKRTRELLPMWLRQARKFNHRNQD